MNENTLNKYSKKIFSQFGEDGIILEILNRFTKKNLDNWCVEFGARDGISDSNTQNLIKNYKYKAVLIEGDKKYFTELCKNFPQEEIVKINKFVNFDGQNKLDNLLKSTNIPKNFDFLSIDIDGCDYYIFESLSEYKPKILSIEFNQLIPNAVEFVQKKDFKIKQGCSARSLVNLAKKKNYELVASTLTNLFFVDKSYSNMILKNSVNLNDLIDDKEIQNYIFPGYDGSLQTTKPLKLGWHKIKIRNKDIQPLPSFLRYFPDDYNLLQKIIFLLFREFKNPGRFIKKFLSKKKID